MTFCGSFLGFGARGTLALPPIGGEYASAGCIADGMCPWSPQTDLHLRASTHL